MSSLTELPAFDGLPQVRKQMRFLQGHFLVATLAPLRPSKGRGGEGEGEGGGEGEGTGAGAAAEAQFEPPRSHELVNSRHALLQFCTHEQVRNHLGPWTLPACMHPAPSPPHLQFCTHEQLQFNCLCYALITSPNYPLITP